MEALSLLRQSDVFSAPKSEIAGDIVGVKIAGDVPEADVVSPTGGITIERGPRGFTVVPQPSTELGDERVVRMVERATGRLLLELTIPLREAENREVVTATHGAGRDYDSQLVASFTEADQDGHDRFFEPGNVFRVTLPEHPDGETWLPDGLPLSPWSPPLYFDLLDDSTLPGRRLFTYRVRTDALHLVPHGTPAALSLCKLRPGETYEDWSRRRGGSGADFTLSTVIEPG